MAIFSFFPTTKFRRKREENVPCALRPRIQVMPLVLFQVRTDPWQNYTVLCDVVFLSIFHLEQKIFCLFIPFLGLMIQDSDNLHLSYLRAGCQIQKCYSSVKICLTMMYVNFLSGMTLIVGEEKRKAINQKMTKIPFLFSNKTFIMLSK